LLDQLLAGGDAAAALQQGGLLDPLKKALAERSLNAGLDHHLGQDEQAGNSRNGYGRKTVATDTGKIEIEVPRDRQGSLDPQLIAKYQRRFPGFGDKIISMYARGMRTQEITGHLRALYGIDGLKGFPDAITVVFPEAIVQTYIVHLLRNSMDFVPWKHRKPLTGALEGIYRAVDAKAGEEASPPSRPANGSNAILPSARAAPGVERGHPFLRLPRGGPRDRLHYECHRGSKCPAPAGSQGQGPFPQRRGRNQAALSDLEPLGERVENAAM
jgi:hypothetical protein